MKNSIALEMAVDLSRIERTKEKKELIRYNKNRLIVSILISEKEAKWLFEMFHNYHAFPDKKDANIFAYPNQRDKKEVELYIDCTKDISHKIH